MIGKSKDWVLRKFDGIIKKQELEMELTVRVIKVQFNNAGTFSLITSANSGC